MRLWICTTDKRSLSSAATGRPLRLSLAWLRLGRPASPLGHTLHKSEPSLSLSTPLAQLYFSAPSSSFFFLVPPVFKDAPDPLRDNLQTESGSFQSLSVNASFPLASFCQKQTQIKKTAEGTRGTSQRCKRCKHTKLSEVEEDQEMHAFFFYFLPASVLVYGMNL
ncbi:hypothetical protein CHARACLAT_006170 [Characodon lateralis]|uniref:Uncharacterized protein n=1 Tax=Characodon lateralis TaxID=208331 RepID=A0ABU7EI53_9TELE|nr:hypothetical protein [Characodon lateralis]